jgi:hypothetical protein
MHFGRVSDKVKGSDAKKEEKREKGNEGEGG